MVCAHEKIVWMEQANSGPPFRVCEECGQVFDVESVVMAVCMLAPTNELACELLTMFRDAEAVLRARPDNFEANMF